MHYEAERVTGSADRQPLSTSRDALAGFVVMLAELSCSSAIAASS